MIALVAILGIIFIEGMALSQGIDGVATSAACAAIGGIGGWYMKVFIDYRKSRPGAGRDEED